MKIDNKVECNDDENEDECDQTTFVWLRFNKIFKTSETFVVLVICYKLIAHSEKCIMYALGLHVFNRSNVEQMK